MVPKPTIKGIDTEVAWHKARQGPLTAVYLGDVNKYLFATAIPSSKNQALTPYHTMGLGPLGM